MDWVALAIGVVATPYGAWCVAQGVRSLPRKPPVVESHDPPPDEPPTRTSAGGLMYGMTAQYHGGWLLGWGTLVVLVGMFMLYSGFVG